MESEQSNITELSLVILGATNAGKSTLMNKLFGSNIVHTASQTNSTKINVLATKNHKNCQIIFYDTPGLGTKHQLKKLYHTSQSVIKQTDYILVLCDGSQPIFPKYLLDYIPPHKPLFVVLNKVDLTKKHLLDLTDRVYQIFKDSNTVHFVEYISALKDDGIELLLDKLVDYSKIVQKWKFTDKYTNQNIEARATEAIRGALFQYYHQEIPHAVKIDINIVDKKIYYILHAKLSQKNIILNKISQFKKRCQYLIRLFVPGYSLGSIDIFAY